MKVTIGRIVHYRGRLGMQTPRAAIVTTTTESLSPDAPAAYALTSDTHVHLWVYGPGPSGGFTELDAPFSDASNWADLPPGHWCWPPRVS
jgi:hypothetical protein